MDLVDRVSKAVVVVGSTVELEEVVDGVGEEKIVKFRGFSLVVAFKVVFFEFFPFSRSVGDRDVATQVRELILRF